MQAAEELKAFEDYSLRPYEASDIPFIHSSWGSSYYTGANYHFYLTPTDFHKKHRPIRESFLSNAAAAVIMITSPSDPDLILGWVALEKIKEGRTVLQYMYIKKAFQGLGIGGQVLKKTTSHQQATMFTHLTEKAARIMAKRPHHYDHMFYAPHLA